MIGAISTGGRLFAAAVVGVLLCGTGASAARQQEPGPAPAPATAPAREGAAGADAAQANPVVVTAVEGKARVRARASADAPWQIVEVGMRLPQGAQIHTGTRSRVVCSVPPGREFVVDRMSTVTVLAVDHQGNRATTDLLMEYGRADLRVQAAGMEHDAKIRTPGATASVRGTELSVYNQPPFAPELRTFTGVVDYRFAKRQMSVAAGGASRGGRGAAETALLQSVVDPAAAAARTNADASLIAEQTSLGAVVTYPNDDIRLPQVRGGGPQTSAQIQNNLRGRLQFVARWAGNADVDIFVAVDPGDPTDTLLSANFQPETILYPGFGLETSATGGRVPYNHRGGRNGGQEICFWPDDFPTAVYGFSAVNNSTSTPADVRFNVYRDGEKISMYTIDPDLGLLRSKGVRRTVAPESSESTLVAVPPSDLFELIFPESPDETLDGTEPPQKAPPPPPGKDPGGVLAGVQAQASQAVREAAPGKRGRAKSADAGRKAAARQQARALKATRVASAREARAARAAANHGGAKPSRAKAASALKRR